MQAQNQQPFNPNQQNQHQFNPNQQPQIHQNQQPTGNNMFNQNNYGMMQEQQKINLEVNKKLGYEMGEILKKQKQIMNQIIIIEDAREKQRKNGDLVLAFNHNNDYGELFTITIKANEFVASLVNEYVKHTNNRNVRLFFKENELTENDARCLYEIEGLVSGEEIIVKDKN